MAKARYRGMMPPKSNRLGTLFAALAFTLTSVFGLSALPTAAENSVDTGVELEENSTFHPESTNALNYAKEVPGREGQSAPYVIVDEVGFGEVTLKFVNDTNSLAFFEYRIDGETVGETEHPVVNTNVNHPTSDKAADKTDVIHPGVSVDGQGVDKQVETQTFEADETVDIRLALGGERDWDFDWTTFEVLADAQTKQDCKRGGFADFDFRNQGQCIRYVNTGQDSR